MNNTNPIIGITLEGFQVFDKPTYIPLERLTLLFGPNSAGKSAVQDAIELYEALMNRELYEDLMSRFCSDSNKAKDMLMRHWRRTGGDDEKYVQKMGLSVTHTSQWNILPEYAAQLNRNCWGEFLAKNGNELEMESRWLFEIYDDDDYEFQFSTSFEFLIESLLVVKDTINEFIVNLAHPLLSQIELKVDFSEVANLYPDDMSLKDGKLTIKSRCFGFHPSGPAQIGTKAGEHWLGFEFGINYKHPSNDKASLLAAAITELNLLLGQLMSTSSCSSRFQPIKVAASRTVPSRQDLRFQFGELDDPLQQMVSSKENIYRRLAESLTSDLEHTQLSYPSIKSIKYLANSVNQALSDHLFIEQGYRLDYEFRLLMSKENSRRGMIEGMGLDPSEFGFIVEIYLRDGKGRKHLFEDVGSGIGYLLPVLCAVYEQSGFESTCFIQQPELHIHPALQSAMGDVFIEGSGDNRQILIETHSEHLLLRIIKRIRQTHLQAAIAPELKIEADDVCVLYFDPSPDGTTTVKRLRITEDGEFMDRWPRGFFGERDQELLDE
jgi:hypothetical protein